LQVVPRGLLTRMFRLALREDAKDKRSGEPRLRDLIPTQSLDYRLVREARGTLDSVTASGADVLLLGGSRSPPALKHVLDVLSHRLSGAERHELPGLGHDAAIDGRKQVARVAAEIRRFCLPA
jgi:pimeloyl-ACP methyl ester carboxylesterase